MIQHRFDRITVFLRDAGWGDAQRAPLAGDASARRYERLMRGGGVSAVLMDAPPERGEDIRPFVQIAQHLSHHGFSAPEVLAEDPAQGFLLLEDLGDDLFFALADSPDRERQMYQAATDMLADLHTVPLPEGIATYGPALMAERARLAAEWYAPGLGAEPPDPRVADRIEAATRALLEAHAPRTDVLALRDFHAQNLLWLPQRAGAARVGLLDFQDAMAGHPIYDLVSFLQDARRDVAPELARQMRARYAARAGWDEADLERAYAVLGAQRALRILGVFARLSLLYSKPAYVELIPRVWAQLQENLAHPVCATLQDEVCALLPPPEAAGLERLRKGAGSRAAEGATG